MLGVNQRQRLQRFPIALSPPWDPTLLPEAAAAAQAHPGLVGPDSAGSWRRTVLGTRQ